MHPPLPYNILLIGFMGTGKTTVSRTLGKRLPMKEVDIDKIIIKRTGKTIADIFAEQGEAAFRKLETEILTELQQQKGLIISCGGGLAMQDVNLPIMKQGATVVLLTATPKTILARIGKSTNRPLLKGRMNEAGIAELMDLRRPKYEAVADLTIETDGKSITQICDELIAKLYQA